MLELAEPGLNELSFSRWIQSYSVCAQMDSTYEQTILLWDGPSEENYSISLPLGLQEFLSGTWKQPQGTEQRWCCEHMGFSKLFWEWNFLASLETFQHLGHRGGPGRMNEGGQGQHRRVHSGLERTLD